VAHQSSLVHLSVSALHLFDCNLPLSDQSLSVVVSFSEFFSRFVQFDLESTKNATFNSDFVGSKREANSVAKANGLARFGISSKLH